MRKFLIPALLIFATGCASTGPSKTEPATPAATRVVIRQVCEPIYGRDSDWDVISDDLARNIYRHNRMCAEIAHAQK
ncbi:MAG: hypothetical protein FWF97_02695 [Alphaproteobacteria bacterium]|nr:hypothetical protein [Alphaproteobacteria bacterium]